jgi:hypothetical protein
LIADDAKKMIWNRNGRELMRIKALFAIVLTIGASSDLRADQYPVRGVWAALDQTQPSGGVTSCESFSRSPKSPAGHIIIFQGCKCVDFNGDCPEKATVNDIAVQKDDLDRQALAMFMRAQPLPSIADDIADKANPYSLLINSVKAGRPKPGSGSLPKRIGQCAETSILAITDRFGQQLLRSPSEEGFDSGTAIEYANGGFQISYHNEAAVIRSAIGDKVKICLVEIPRDCPLGDDRGRVYNTKNLRTGESWTLADAQHGCGGA